ncbi:hypothetical protein H4Q26_012539 [Puccinia striiformis f. sp. tritici PST-130]|uniref:Uncharacterized protein n=1 Tax=Puccinia striiformis f. sp. tritici PST-78 TaxID=1165861 RepID=A0A0L0VV72_9BASI|nr:hypothetical protein H4Q26_012539 [Puccinia striiformis f. sp. tritici PST-130]KNF02905.1 hypothetical protein PSTG_03852 [Puccinia striiformis f. sp. tritici PST-78]
METSSNISFQGPRSLSTFDFSLYYFCRITWTRAPSIRVYVTEESQGFGTGQVHRNPKQKLCALYRQNDDDEVGRTAPMLYVVLMLASLRAGQIPTSHVRTLGSKLLYV